jgi:hypothetical protein
MTFDVEDDSWLRDSYVFSFPVRHVQTELTRAPADRLLAELVAASDKCIPLSEARLPYRDVRRKICSIHLILNAQGLIAPRFRESRTPRVNSKGQCTREEDWDISNDRQLIDLHWLYCRWTEDEGHRLDHVNRKWREIFSGCEFNFQMAERFVSRVGRASVKAGELGLMVSEQRQLSTIQDESVRQRWSRINKRRGAVMGKLRERAVSNRQLRPRVPEWADCWVAGQLADGKPCDACEIYRFMTGKTVSHALMSKRLKTMSALKL